MRDIKDIVKEAEREAERQIRIERAEAMNSEIAASRLSLLPPVVSTRLPLMQMGLKKEEYEPDIKVNLMSGKIEGKKKK